MDWSPLCQIHAAGPYLVHSYNDKSCKQQAAKLDESSKNDKQTGQIVLADFSFDATALAACEIAYQLYPNISFAVNFMLKAGEAICETAVLSDPTLASDANLEDVQKETVQGTVGNIYLGDI